MSSSLPSMFSLHFLYSFWICLGGSRVEQHDLLAWLRLLNRSGSMRWLFAAKQKQVSFSGCIVCLLLISSYFAKMNLRKRFYAVDPASSDPVMLENPPAPPAKRKRSSRIVEPAPVDPFLGPKRVRSGERGGWSKEDLDLVIEAIEQGLLSIKKSSKHFGIPETTLRNHLYGISENKFGAVPRALSLDEENCLLEWAFRMCQEGKPVTLDVMRERVASMTINRPTCFVDGLPGAKWWRGFKKRHPQLALRSTQCVEAVRIRAMSTKNLDNFFDTLTKVYEDLNLDPSRIWNVDETGIQAGMRQGMRVISRKGQREVYEATPNCREWVTVLVCVSAAGMKLPNLYVFKGKRIRDTSLLNGCEAGAILSFQKKAWITDILFENWLDHFKKHVPGGICKDRPHLLVCDGHGSHITLETIVKAKEIGLHIVKLPPHTSHKLQPLDVSVFGPFKANFRRYRAKSRHDKFLVEPSKEDIATMISKSINEATTSENIHSGFAKTGIWPLQPTSVAPDPVADRLEAELAATNADTREEAQGEEMPAPEGQHDAENLDVIANAAEAISNAPDLQEADNTVAPAAATVEHAVQQVNVSNGEEIGQAAIEHAANLLQHVNVTNIQEHGQAAETSKKRRRAPVPASLKNKLYVSADEVILARLEEQKKHEAARKVREEKEAEKKRLQEERKKAKEQEKMRKEEERKKKKEEARRKRELEREAGRPKRNRKKRRYVEYETEVSSEDEEQYIEGGDEVSVAEAGQVADEPEVDTGAMISNNQGVDFVVEIGAGYGQDMFTDSQPISDNEEFIGCSNEDTHECSYDAYCRKKALQRAGPSQTTSSESSMLEKRIRCLDDVYRDEANAHLKKLGL